MNRHRKKVKVPINKKVDSLNLVDLSDMKFPIVVVYNRPFDFPAKIIARVWEGSINKPTNVYCEYDNIDDCRKDAYSAGFNTKIDRNPADDIHIVESYIM